MKIYRDSDPEVSPALIQSKKIAIIGYGNQGHAHALNLRDSGVGELVIALRAGSKSREVVTAAGFKIMGLEEAAAWADITMLLTPDEGLGDLYEDVLKDNLKSGAAIGFAHGLAIRFGMVKPRDDLDVIMVAPKGPGRTLRALYLDNLGMPTLIAVEQDVSGIAKSLAISYAAALGAGRAGIIESSFAEECETDLFTEQAVLCGGMPALVRAAFEILVERGYTPEVAYIECLHELKQVVDLMWEGGLEHMDMAISNTAEFGGYRAGEKLGTPALRKKMEEILDDVQSGKFVKEFLADTKAGHPYLEKNRERDRSHEIERAGKTIRALMPWLGDQAKK